MANRGHRTKYQAVTGVLMIWMAIGATAFLAKPYQPEPTKQEQLRDRGSFVREGAGPYIKWLPFGQEAIRIAKQTDKPILLVSGYAWSSIAVNWESIFSVPDVAELVNKEFVPVRVDLLENPAWLNLALPLTRTRRADSKEYGIYVLSPEAEILWAPSEQEILSLNDRRLLGRLRHAHSMFGFNITKEEQQIQEMDLAIITGNQTSEFKQRNEILDQLANSQSPSGGTKFAIGVNMRPPDWEVLMDHGGTVPVHQAIEHMILSHRLDWLYGGVFDRFTSTNPLIIEPIKTSDGNAGFLRVLARLYVHHPSEWLEQTLDQQFEFLLGNFCQADSPSFIGWKTEIRGRTQAHSFSPVNFSQAVKSSDRAWATDNLGLPVANSPQAMVSPQNLDVFGKNRPQFESILTQLRAANADIEPSVQGDHSNAAQARAITALLVAARYREDDVMRGKAIAAFYALRDDMKSGTDDIAEQTRPAFVLGSLTTYTAYASASMEAYQLTNDESLLAECAAIVRRAKFLFFKGEIGPLLGIWKDSPQWSRYLVPELLDTVRPATAPTMAMIALRLSASGEFTLQETDPWLRPIRDGFSVASSVPSGSGSLISAMDMMNQSAYLVFRGNPQWRDWESAFVQAPTRSPQPGPPGLYAKVGDEFRGPLSLSEAKLLIKP